MNNQLKGKYGEDLAVSYLEKQDYEIIERNYRHGRGEIDLIGIHKNQLLVFFEIKLRKNSDFGPPETFVTSNQERLIMEAAEQYLLDIHWMKDIRFDIIAIQGEKIDHFQDAFH
ncbi:MAG: YraN family protein [Cyclobacteriaceae bacterium]